MTKRLRKPVWGLVVLVVFMGCGVLDSEDSRDCIEESRRAEACITDPGCALELEPDASRELRPECSYDNFRVLFAERYDIDGYVLDGVGSPVEGVKITKEGGDGGWTLTDAEGYYLVGNNIPGLDYCLIPSKEGCTFTPARRCYEDLDQHHHSQDFLAACVGRGILE